MTASAKIELVDAIMSVLYPFEDIRTQARIDAVVTANSQLWDNDQLCMAIDGNVLNHSDRRGKYPKVMNQCKEDLRPKATEILEAQGRANYEKTLIKGYFSTMMQLTDSSKDFEALTPYSLHLTIRKNDRFFQSKPQMTEEERNDFLVRNKRYLGILQKRCLQNTVEH